MRSVKSIGQEMLWRIASAEKIVALNSEISRKVAVIASVLKLRITCSPNVSGFPENTLSSLGLMTIKIDTVGNIELSKFQRSIKGS